MKAKIIYMNPEMEKLKKKHPNDAGIDLRANLKIEEVDMWLSAGEQKLIGTGVKIDIPKGYGAYVQPRSSMNKAGLLLQTGTIDSGYQGEIMITIKNMNNHAVIIEDQQRVAQLIFFEVPQIEFEEVTEFENVTSRGSNGFGSSGKF